jgi:RNA polymerase sporulation-specific sigma factor
MVGLDRWSGPSLVNLLDEEVVSLAQSGDRLAGEHLLSRFRGLVEGKARTFFLSGAEHEDVVQEGMIGLYKAIRDYQPGRFVRFRAFAEVCVTRQIISAVKSASRRKHLPLNRYVPIHWSDGEDPVCLGDVLSDRASEDPEAAVLNSRLTDYFERYGTTELSELENHVIRCRLEGKSYRQVADELRCHPKCVDNALQRAKRKIWSRISTAD